MMTLKMMWLLVMLAMPMTTGAAPVETFRFDSPETERLFHKLSEELRCLVCQNQNIAESNAGLAKDLRLELYNMLTAGKSEAEIIDFMVQRYGDYVLYRPPFKPLTWLLWVGPGLLFVIALFFVVRLVRKQSADSAAPVLSDEEKARIEQLKSALARGERSGAAQSGEETR